jgi:tyrosyl-tRNA synthetase
MGKTASGAVWLDPNKTSPFDFYQYWRNVDDADVIKCMKLLTFIPVETIHEYETFPGERINELKEILATEITAMVHGEEEANKAKEAARALFSGQGDDTNMPTTELEIVNEEGEGLLNLLVVSGLATSRGEARRVVEQGGISVNGEKVTNINTVISKQSLIDGIKVKKGKKVFHKIVLK